MKLSQREKRIVWVVVAVVGLWAGDQYGLTPYMDKRAALAKELDQARATALQNQRLIDLYQPNLKTLKEMQDNGLTSDPSAMEGRVLHSVDDWARDARLSLQTVKRERMEQDKQYGRIVFNASGTGNMEAVSRFLWNIQTAKIPARVTDAVISSRKDGVDDLQLTVKFSTLVAGPVPTTQQQPQPQSSAPQQTQQTQKAKPTQASRPTAVPTTRKEQS